MIKAKRYWQASGLCLPYHHNDQLALTAGFIAQRHNSMSPSCVTSITKWSPSLSKVGMSNAPRIIDCAGMKMVCEWVWFVVGRAQTWWRHSSWSFTWRVPVGASSGRTRAIGYSLPWTEHMNMACRMAKQGLSSISKRIPSYHGLPWNKGLAWSLSMYCRQSMSDS